MSSALNHPWVQTNDALPKKFCGFYSAASRIWREAHFGWPIIIRHLPPKPVPCAASPGQIEHRSHGQEQAISLAPFFLMK
jgi:hypothetical protein